MRGALLLVGSLLAFNSSVAAKPNIIIFLADDMGWNDVGYHNPGVSTPNIDRLAKNGIELDRFYVNSLCSPTRASLMSGLFVTSHGVLAPVQSHKTNGMPLDIKILPEFLKDLGYSTHMVGKWHLGHANRAYWPQNRGFDSFYGSLGGGAGYFNHIWDGGLDLQSNGNTVFNATHLTYLVRDESLRVIEERTEKPFFLFASFNAPHAPIESVAQDPSSADYHEPNGRKTYLEMIRELDDVIGSVLSALEVAEILEDTLIIFASDNGGQEPQSFIFNYFLPIAREAFASNDPLRADKGKTFEGGVRVPAVIWWQDRFVSDLKIQQPFHIADLLPTILKIVGLNGVGFDGVSQLELLDKKNTKKHNYRESFVVGGIGSEALYDWPFKLVKEVSLPFVPDFFSTENYYLFNLIDDPFEETDLKKSHSEIYDEMSNKMKSLERRSVVELDLSQGLEAYGGEITKQPWAEAAQRVPGH